MINISNIVKKYDNSNYELNIESLQLKPRHIYALLGKNGAGKSTFIKILLGILDCNQGHIEYSGININKDSLIKREIGYVPDEPILYDSLTGSEHIKFIQYLYKTNNDLYAKELYKLFAIDDKIDTLINGYSKGMKQKISIISALVHNPNYLILDEPFTGLDPLVIINFKDLLLDFVTKTKKVVLFSTHDLDVANDVCTDAIFIDNGRIVGIESISNIKNDNNTLSNKFKTYIL